jgi:hypothetical protein
MFSSKKLLTNDDIFARLTIILSWEEKSLALKGGLKYGF